MKKDKGAPCCGNEAFGKKRKKKRIHSGEEGDLNRRGGKEREGEGEKEW